MTTTRLRELCDAAEKGALRGEEMQELVTLAREVELRYSAIKAAAATDPLLCLPCKCGHSAWDHWLLQVECDHREQCKCLRFERA